MDSLFSKLAGDKEDSKNSTTTTTTTATGTNEEVHSKNHRPSNTELMASAKYAAEAAKLAVNNQSDKVDKAKAAGAAEDLLAAASQYGKLEDKSYGKYVEKAEDYLHQYHSSHSSTTTGTAAPASDAHDSTVPAPSAPADHEKSGGADYFKMAQGFLNK